MARGLNSHMKGGLTRIERGNQDSHMGEGPSSKPSQSSENCGITPLGQDAILKDLVIKIVY